MHTTFHKQTRLTALAIAVAAGFFFLPATAGRVELMGYPSAWAGDQGGGHDHVGGGQEYTNYDAGPTPPAAQPCGSCLNGAMGSGYVPPVPAEESYTEYSAEPGSAAPAPCESCLTGATGTGYVAPVPLDQIRRP
jgi:hypothetical protein